MKKSLWLLALLAGPGFAQDILLAPGRSITILDAADPSVRVVLSAPKNAPLNLSAILVTDPKESVYSIVTRLQLNGAGGLARNADGSMALSGPAATPTANVTVLQGGVLVYSGGKYVYHAVSQPAAPTTPAVPPAARAASGGGRLLISKPGVGKEQAERDIAQCRRYAEGAAAQFLRNADKVMMFNSAMRSCLESFGYQIHAPSA